MKLLSTIIIFMLFNISLSANDISFKRIYITYTLEKKHIESIHNILKKMNIKIYVDKKEKKYLIYSKKYLINDAKIYNDFKIIKAKFKNAQIITHKKKIKSIKPKLDNTFHINLSAGTSNIISDYDYDFNKEYALNYELEFAYLINKSISLSLSYINTSQEEIDIHNVCAALNYTFHPTQNFYILFGLLGGYSTLEFNNQQNTQQSASTLIGLKNNFGYKLSNNFNLFIQYNAIYFEHIILDESSSSNITFNYINNVTVGIGLRF